MTRNRPLLLGDKIVLVLAGCLVVSLYWLIWTGHDEADLVQLRIADAKPEQISLHLDRTVTVAGKLGDSVLEVRDGRIRFLSSPCPNQICVHAGWLANAGDVAACLPNQVSLQVLGNQGFFDSINF